VVCTGLNDPELENALGFSMNDYGGHGKAGDVVASWHFENPAPLSLLFHGPANDVPGCV
jgi:hypothetical protein